MNILFYTPFNYRSRDTESLMIRFKKMGHNVHFISQLEGNKIKDVLLENGIHVLCEPITIANRKIRFILSVLHLIFYCRKNKIDVVFSHLEPANFVSVICQYFIKAKVIIGRHHVDEVFLVNQSHSFSYRFTYARARHIIAVSERARQFMIEHEAVKPEKIEVIKLSYDFDLYHKVNTDNVNAIRNQFNCGLLLVTACRMVKDKRPELSLELVKKLRNSGLDAKLILLGEGPHIDFVLQSISNLELEDACFYLGRKDNILDYLCASDVLVHPSILDSSSVIVKEAGLVQRTVIVCKDVGDCDEYIEHKKQGFLVDKEHFVEEAAEILIHSEKSELIEMGKRLNQTIVELFSIDNTIKYYEKFVH